MAKKKETLLPSQQDDKGGVAQQEAGTSLATAIISRNTRLEGLRSTFMNQWERLGWLFMPSHEGVKNGLGENQEGAKNM